jgi:tRNA(Ile)-lysidine synthase
VALGHTASDQAETVLMRAVRGTGLQGLAGMDWRQGIFIRPLLDVSRRQVRAYIRRHGLAPVEDPTNAGDDYLRNRVRRQVIPLLRQENPRVEAALARLADSCREDHRALTDLARSLLSRASAGGRLELAAMRDAPAALRHRALRLAYADAVGSTRRLTRDHVLALDALLQTGAGSAALDLPAARAVRTYDALRFETGGVAEPELAPVRVEGPGEVQLSDGRRLQIRELPPVPARRPGQQRDPGRPWLLARSAASFPLLVRGPRPGDRIATGPQMTRKVARVLLDAKIPRPLRARVPLVLSRDRVLLVLGVRRAFDCAPKSMENVVSVQISPATEDSRRRD